MTTAWNALSPESRSTVREVVADLLHDWIKYMEMRLLSVDWSEPPESAAAILDRAIFQTRRHGDRTSGARALWAAQRPRLVGVAAGDPAAACVDTLVTDLDSDVATLEALAEAGGEPGAVGPEGIEGVVRRPGRRLRAVRDALEP